MDERKMVLNMAVLSMFHLKEIIAIAPTLLNEKVILLQLQIFNALVFGFTDWYSYDAFMNRKWLWMLALLACSLWNFYGAFGQF
jgi:hypothetical protein